MSSPQDPSSGIDRGGLIGAAIRYPVTVAVGVLLAVFGGLLALTSVPIQLTPEFGKPVIHVTTIWPGASPEEIEKEIVEEQEEVLKTVEGVVEMQSDSQDSTGHIALEFRAGTDLDSAIVRVTNKLSQVPSYPQNAELPVVSTLGPFDDESIAWFVVHSENGGVDVAQTAIFLEDHVKPRLERVPGVSGIGFFGALFRELHVTYDPDLLASMGITISELAAALQADSQDISAGDFGEGKRRYVVRTMARYRNLDEVAQTVIKVRAGVPIRVGDVAEVALGFQKAGARVRYQGRPAVAMNAQRQLGSNTLEVARGLVAEVEKINRELLEPRDMNLHVAHLQSDYIEASIDRVMENIYLGGLLAVAVLFLFLRSASSIVVVGLSIPISVVTSFLAMFLLGRTINVISLAGMAFAVGMVVDAAIVVLENIFRHLQMGKSRVAAALDGTKEVWGAVLASTVTTVAVFLPIFFIQERAGQLFRDIALAISSAIVVSLVVAVTVIPSASALILTATRREHHEGGSTRLGRLAERISGLVDFFNAGSARRLVVMAVVVGLAVGLTWLLVPSAEYLPNGNQNFIFGVMLPPPGYHIDEVLRDGESVESQLQHLWGASLEEAADLPGGGGENFWYVAMPGMAFLALGAREPDRVGELLEPVNSALSSIPGSLGFASQWSLFADGLAGTRSVRVDVTGPELERVLELAGNVFGRISPLLPGSISRPIPALDLGNPELRVYPDRVRAANAGLDAADIGRSVNSLIDGMKVAEYFHQGREIDLILKGSDEWSRHTQSVAQLPLATPSGEIITLGDVAEVRQQEGPIQINHVEGQRAVSIEVRLPDDIPLEEAIATLESDLLEPMTESGELDGLYGIRLRGAADDLTRLRSALGLNFLIVVVLTYLLLAALFQSFLYPVVIMVTVPLATLGGVLGLRLVQIFSTDQQLDILTMLGFVILVGTVINNAILIVYQALNLTRQSREAHDAVREAVRVRVRPILMSTITSSLGMLPLVIMPGAGSELYRGLGAVVIGGLLLSTAITLILTPLVFTFVFELRQSVARRFGRTATVADSAPVSP